MSQVCRQWAVGSWQLAVGSWQLAVDFSFVFDHFFTAYCLLPTAHGLLLTAYCLLPTET
jgi:hypothetical protein